LLFRQHQQRCIALGITVGERHHRRGDQTVAVFHQRIRLRFAEPDATVSGNTCTGGLRGFYADNDLLRPTISENSFAGWGGDQGAAGMFFKGELHGAIIHHNAVKSPAGEGPGILVLSRTSAENTLESNDIDLSGARHGSGIDYRGLQAQITGNRVLNAPEDGISVEAATEARVEGNTITHAGRRAITPGGMGNTVRDNVER
jgi:nitrous oxidase accessory protein NosD